MTSQPFCFVVGDEKTEFWVNEAAFSHMSPDVFGIMLEGRWKDSEVRRVAIPDVSKEAFARLCEFSFTGNYSNPSPRLGHAKRKAEPEKQGSSPKRARTEGGSPATATSASPLVSEIPGSDSAGSSETEFNHVNGNIAGGGAPNEPNPAANKPLYSLYSACRAFENYQRDLKVRPEKPPRKKSVISQARYDIFKKFLNWRLHWEETPGRYPLLKENRVVSESWLPVFLGHAEMYRLGDKYDVRGLRDASRAKMHRALKFWVVYPANIGDLTSLLRYIYDNTVERDKMREMLYYYTSCLLQDINDLPEFQHFLQCAPEFASRMVQSMASFVRTFSS